VLFNLNANILQLVNGDLFFHTYSSDNQNLYIEKTDSSIATGGDFYLTAPSLKQYTNFKLYSVDYTELSSGTVIENDPTIFLIRIAVNEGLTQPRDFILRIFNGINIFKDSFQINLGNSGVYWQKTGEDDTYFIFDDNYSFESQVSSQVTTKNHYLSLIVLAFLFIFLLNIKMR
jgi:hypothetical protein